MLFCKSTATIVHAITQTKEMIAITLNNTMLIKVLLYVTFNPVYNIYIGYMYL